MATQSIERPANPTRQGTPPVIVRARSTCSGAHVHVGSLPMRHEELPAFAARYQAMPATSTLATLTSSAVNEIIARFGPEAGVRVYGIEAAASCDSYGESETLSMALFIESPDEEAAVRRAVDAWQQVYATSTQPEGTSLNVSLKVVDWYRP